jgi:hypothetical protein
MGNGGSRGSIGPRCNGTHPAHINDIRNRSRNSVNYIVQNVDRIDNLIKKYKDAEKRVNDDTQNIEWWYSVRIPDRIAELKRIETAQIVKKQGEYDDAVIHRDKRKKLLEEMFKKLNNLHTNSATLDTDINTVTTNTNNKKGENIKLDGIINQTYKQIYNAVRTENDILFSKNENINELYSADKSKMEQQQSKNTWVMSIRFWLFILYYILIIFIGYLMIYADINFYSKLILLFILVVYPLYIYNVQYTLHSLWNILYANLRTYGPEN